MYTEILRYILWDLDRQYISEEKNVLDYTVDNESRFQEKAAQVKQMTKSLMLFIIV